MFKRFFRKLDAIVFSGFFEQYSNQKNNANLLKLASIDLDYNYTTFIKRIRLIPFHYSATNMDPIRDLFWKKAIHMAGRHIHILTTIICYFLLDASISKKFLNVALEQIIQIFYPQWARWESQAHHYEFGVTTFLMQLFMGQTLIGIFFSLKIELKRFTLIN